MMQTSGEQELRKEHSGSAESRHETVATDLVCQFEGVGETFGAEALRGLIRAMYEHVERGEVMSREELAELFAEQTPREEFQREALYWLEKDGFVAHRSDGVLVVNAKRLLSDFDLRPYRAKETDLMRERDISSRDIPGRETFGKNKVEFLANVFDGQKVVLTDDPFGTEPKPLFYLPKTRSAAFDPEQIRSAEFHLGLWEIPHAAQSLSLRDAKQPVALEEIGFLEATAAALIFHPWYGAGERKDRNRLIVKGKDGKPVRFSGKWLAEQGLEFSDAKGSRDTLKNKPLDTLMRYAPELFRRGLLEVSDIQTRHDKAYEAERTHVSTSGEVAIEGVKYYLGRQWKDKPIRVERVVPGLGAIIELDEKNRLTGRIVATFRLYEAGDRRLTKQETNTGTAWRAGAKEVALEEFTPSAFHRMREGEDLDGLRARVTAVEQFELFLQLDNKLKTELGVRVRELPAEEVGYLRESRNLLRSHQQDVVAFVEAFPQEGLHLVALMADIPKVIPEMHRVTVAMTPEERRVFLRGFTELAQARCEAIHSLEEMVESGSVEEDDARMMRFELGLRLKGAVTSADGLIRTRKATHSSDVLKRIEKDMESSIVFAELFRDAFKGFKNVDLGQVRWLAIEQKKPADIPPHVKATMLEIAEENWRGSVLSEYVPDTIRAKLSSSAEETEWVILRHDGAVSGFLRFDRMEDPHRLYLGSVNVTPEERGSGIGEALLAKVVNKRAADHVLELHAEPKSTVSTSYSEALGFVITGVEEVHGVPLFQMVRDDRVNEHYALRAPEWTEERLLRLMREKDELPSGVRMVDFDADTATDAMVQFVEETTKAGDVVTRYIADPTNPMKRFFFVEKAVKMEEESRPVAA